MFGRLLILVAATLPLVSAAEIKVVEEIAAKVNGDIITRGELEQTRREIEAAAKAEGLAGSRLSEAVQQAQRDALRDRIDEMLLVQKAKESPNINVEPEITRWLAQLQVRAKISDNDKFAEFIRQQFGMTIEEVKQRQRNQMMAQRVVSQEVASRMAIPEAELRAYYEANKEKYVRQEQVFLSQILISTEGMNEQQTAEAEKKAKDLMVRARAGEKFGDMAAANSDDPDTARNGGYLGAYKRSDLRQEIADAVFGAKKGFVTDPIKLSPPAPPGFLILKVEERYEAGQATFEEVKEEIQSAMAEPRMGPKVREYLTRLREDAFLEIKEGYVDSGAAPGKDTTWHDVAPIKPQTTTKVEVLARQRKKFLWIIPYGRVGTRAAEEAQKTQSEPAPKAPENPAQK